MGSVFNYLQLLPIPFLDGNTKVFIMGFGRFQVLSYRVSPFCWEHFLPASQKWQSRETWQLIWRCHWCNLFSWLEDPGRPLCCMHTSCDKHWVPKEGHTFSLSGNAARSAPEQIAPMPSHIHPALFWLRNLSWDTAFHLVCSTHRRVKSDISPRLGSSEAIISVFLTL